LSGIYSLGGAQRPILYSRQNARTDHRDSDPAFWDGSTRRSGAVTLVVRRTHRGHYACVLKAGGYRVVCTLRRLIVVAILDVVITAAAATAVSSPGLLRPADLPDGLDQIGEVQTFPNLDSEVIDPSSCTLSTKPFVGALGVSGVEFGPASGTPAEALLTERVVSFANEVAARRAYAREAASHVNGLHCGTVKLLASDGTSPPSLFSVESQKLAAVGHRSFAERTLVANANDVPATVSVTYVSGQHLVILAVRDRDGAPTTPGALRSIARRAEKRLGTAPTI
jgi:hypothetical protein